MNTDAWVDELAAQYEQLTTHSGAFLVDRARTVAHIKSWQMRELGRAYVDFQPGNGTSYKMLLVDLRADQRAAVKDRDLTDDEVRTMGPEASWGGRLLVALPEFSRGGRCCAFSPGDVENTFVEEHLGMNSPDAYPVAVFLSLFCDAWLSEAAVTS